MLTSLWTNFAWEPGGQIRQFHKVGKKEITDDNKQAQKHTNTQSLKRSLSPADDLKWLAYSFSGPRSRRARAPSPRWFPPGTTATRSRRSSWRGASWTRWRLSRSASSPTWIRFRSARPVCDLWFPPFRNSRTLETRTRSAEHARWRGWRPTDIPPESNDPTRTPAWAGIRFFSNQPAKIWTILGTKFTFK